VADIEKDPHWQSRQLLVDVPNGAGTIRMHNVVPRMSATPGDIRDAGGALGEDNEAIYGGELGLTGEQRDSLRRAGVI
jgi:succinyl-CoA--D-citramalate CoA-transferase